MSNKKITDLPELTNPTTDDVFPIVDIATNTTLKVQVGNLPVQTAVTTALATKQATLVSGTNIKTINSATLLDSGDIALQTPLVSGTNIKTINGTSVLGSGDIVTPYTPPSGVSGAIQFSNGSAFASDASNLFWDDTNNRLGVGTNAPTARTHIKGSGNSSATDALYLENSDGSQLLKVTNNGILSLGLNFPKIAGSNVIGGFSGGFNCVYNNGAFFSVAENGVPTMVMDSSFQVGIGTSTPTARTHIKGSGSTSATTSLLVQNSAGNPALKITDDLIVSNVNTSNQLSFKFGATNQGIGTRNGDFSIGFSDSTNILGGRLYANGTGNFWMDGLTEGASKAQNYPIIFGSRAAATGNSVGNYTTEENGSQSYFGFYVAQPSAQVIVNSTTRGFLPPRMTTTQKNAIATPAAGLVVYDTTTNKLCCYNGSTWNDLF
jgi:hypothetical protein